MILYRFKGFSDGFCPQAFGVPALNLYLQFGRILMLSALSLLICMSSTSYAQSPGGIGNGLKLWIKSNAGTNCSTAGCSIDEWQDQSGNNDHLEQTSNTKQPVFQTSSVNYNPGIYFDGNDVLRKDISDFRSNFTIFCVTYMDVTTVPQGTVFNNHYGNGAGNGDHTSFQLDSDGSTYRYRNDEELLFGPYVDEFVILAATNTDQGTGGDTRVKAYRDALLVNQVDFDGINRGQSFKDYTLGVNRINNSYMQGLISEVVLYNRELNAVQINRIESYLAVKYGITLGVNGISLDYNSPLGVVIWDVSMNAGYNYDIAGIGRDDQSALNQKQSKSIYDRDYLTVGNGATLHNSNLLNPNDFLTNESYFIWGHNGAGLTCSDQDAGLTENDLYIMERLDRSWKAQETGVVDLTTLEFDMTTAVFGDLSVSDYQLLIDEDGAFEIGAFAIAPSSVDVVNQKIYFQHDFTPATGYYFTLGLTGIQANLHSPGDICSGSSTDLVIEFTQGNGPANMVVLSGPDTIPVNDAEDGTMVTVSPAQTTTYFLYYVDDALCNSSIVMGSATVVVTPTPEPELGNDTMLCLGESLLLDATAPAATYLWQDGSDQATYIATNPGIHWVDVTIDGCTGRDSIDIVYESLEVDLGRDTTICNSTIILNATTPNASYQWQDGSLNPIYAVSVSGTYWVEVTTGICSSSDTVEIEVLTYALSSAFETICEGDSTTINGVDYFSSAGIYVDTLPSGDCEMIVSLQLVVQPLPEYTLDQTICQGDSVTINGSEYYSDAGTYYDVLAGTPCDSAITLNLSFDERISLDLGNDTSICDSSLRLSAFHPDATYLWENGSTSADLIVTESGLYWVMVSSNTSCPDASDSIDVIVNTGPPLVSLSDTTLCDEDDNILSMDLEGVEYTWSTGETTSIIIPEQSGQYWVSIANECGMSTDTFSVDLRQCYCTAIAPTAFTPDEDGFNDAFYVHTRCETAFYQLSVYNRWGEIVFSSANAATGWKGDFNGKAQQLDAYSWILQYIPTLDGEPGELIQKTGMILLLR